MQKAYEVTQEISLKVRMCYDNERFTEPKLGSVDYKAFMTKLVYFLILARFTANI